MSKNQKKLLRTQEVCKLLHISLRQFYRVNQSVKFPNARLVGKTKFWIESEIWGWLETQVVPANAKVPKSMPLNSRGRPTKAAEIARRGGVL